MFERQKATTQNASHGANEPALHPMQHSMIHLTNSHLLLISQNLTVKPKNKEQTQML
jgi:hypothetical protein